MASSRDNGGASEESVAEALLASLDVEQYEPEVLGIVLEQMHRTVQVLLSDARDLSHHCGRDAVSARDVRKARPTGVRPQSLLFTRLKARSRSPLLF